MDPPPKRYRLRSSAPLTKTEEQPKAKPAPKKPKPFIDFKGKVEYATAMMDIASMSDDLLYVFFLVRRILTMVGNNSSYLYRTWVNKQEDAEIPIAFDMEWPFSFQTGSGKTAVIQLCADVEVCYVFHVFDLKRLPVALVSLLNHEKVILHGVNIKKYCILL